MTRISSSGKSYEKTADYVPLRLQEARAALFDPIPPVGSLNRASVRTATTNFNGAGHATGAGRSARRVRQSAVLLRPVSKYFYGRQRLNRDTPIQGSGRTPVPSTLPSGAIEFRYSQEPF